MVMKRGRFGRFLACTRYPDCKGTKPVSIGVACPKGCGGYLTEKRSRPREDLLRLLVATRSCDFVSWDRPLATRPARSAAAPTSSTSTRRRPAPFVACPNKECGYRRDAEAEGGGDRELAAIRRQALQASGFGASGRRLAEARRRVARR